MWFSTGQARPGRERRFVAGLTRLAVASLLGLSYFGTAVEAKYNLDVKSQDSIKKVAATMAEDLMSFYDGDKLGNTPGLLPQPYYWWEAGALMGVLIDYWHYTGDTKYNKLISQGLLFQVGPNNDYMPPNQTLTEGNDDQGFWGMAVMSAAEYRFPDPPKDKPQWLALAQAVFNTQAARWEEGHCGGGLRWQIFTWNVGFNYKNSISQACFFNIAARLALYTGNKTYADWAERTWDWMVGVKFIDENYYVYDGAHIEDNCTKIIPYQFSYNAGAFLHGAAAMYNFTSQKKDHTASIWHERVDGLLNGTSVFFTGDNSDVMFEAACEPVDLCNVDQQSFKAYLSNWMAATTQWAPWTLDRVLPLMQASAKAAAAQCTGGDNGRMCGLKWTNDGAWDGSTGVGQQMAALEVTLATTIHHSSPPVTNKTGGTSQGNPSAGASDVGRTDPWTSTDLMKPISAGEKVGAAFLTVFIVAAFSVGIAFMIYAEEPMVAPASEKPKGEAAAKNAGDDDHASSSEGDARSSNSNASSDGSASTSTSSGGRSGGSSSESSSDSTSNRNSPAPRLSYPTF